MIGDSRLKPVKGFMASHCVLCSRLVHANRDSFRTGTVTETVTLKEELVLSGKARCVFRTLGSAECKCSPIIGVSERLILLAMVRSQGSEGSEIV